MTFDNPNGIASATEEILKGIREDLQKDERDHPYHYNHAFSVIYEVLQKRYATTKPKATAVPKSGHAVTDVARLPKWLNDQLESGSY